MYIPIPFKYVLRLKDLETSSPQVCTFTLCASAAGACAASSFSCVDLDLSAVLVCALKYVPASARFYV